MFSQRNEEEYILRFFQNRKGRFLDLGAYDGKTFSNIRSLALQGWGGVLVEPMPEMHDVLEKLYTDSRFTVLHVGVGLKDETRTFYNFAGDAIGSFNKAHADLWVDRARPYTEVKYKVISIKSLFDEVGWDFEFINIDVEGWSMSVFKKLPFNQLKNLKMICVEFDGNPNKAIQIAETHQFKQYHRTEENIIFTR